MKVKYIYYVISSTRQCGIWGEEQLEVPDRHGRYDTQFENVEITVVTIDTED